MRFRYSTNNDNQLLIQPEGTAAPAAVPGSFAIDKRNRLVYVFGRPGKNTAGYRGTWKRDYAWLREYGFASKIIFDGDWKLTPQYDLELSLNDTETQCRGDSLVVSGRIISVDRDTLAFEVKTNTRDNQTHLQIVKLGVVWFTDDSNRLSFAVKKRAPDILTLEGQWTLNQNQQLTYRYEKEELVTKTKVAQEFVFEGFWRVSAANRLTYILKHSRESKFDFRAQWETPTIYPQEGAIKYRLGCGVREDRISGRVVCLYGTWKFSRRLGLAFRMDYGRDVRENEFGADVFFGQDDKISFYLKDKSGEPLGVELIFTHKLLESWDSAAFLRLKRHAGESRIEAGLSVPF